METLGLSAATRKPRHWLLELLWPRVDTEAAAETAAHNGLWVCLVAAVLFGCSAAAGAGLNIVGFIVGFIFFAYLFLLAIGVGAGSLIAASIALLLVLMNAVVSIRSGFLGIPIVGIISVGLLFGSVRAAIALRRFRRPTAMPLDAPPDLPESAYREAAPEYLRLAAEAEEKTFFARAKRLWRAVSPAGEIAVVVFALGFSGLIVIGMLAIKARG